MKLLRFQDYFDASFFLIRSPLLEYDKAVELLLGIETLPESTRQRLKEIYASSLLKEAVCLSSPDLYAQLLRYLNNEITDKRTIKKIEQSLIQYFIRMSSRCTPFGLLAACSPGKFDTQTNIVFDDLRLLKRFARFDMDFICRMVEVLKSDKTIRHRLKLYPNTSLYRSGSKFRYIEYSVKEEKKTYTMQEISFSSLLSRLIGKAKSGLQMEDLVLAITKDGYDREDAVSYVNQLIDSQVLITDIEPRLTDVSYVPSLMKVAASSEMVCNIGRTLDLGARAFETINQCPDPISIYRELDDYARTLDPNIAKEKLIQVDLFREPVICTISAAVKERTLESLDILKALYGYRIKETRLEHFKRAFFEKYENADVSICEAMDAVTGLNFDSLSSQDIYRDSNSIVYDKIMQYKLQKYAEGINNAEGRVTIERGEVEAIGDNNLPAPDSFSVTINLLKEKDGESIVIRSAGGSSGLNMLSRFCYMDHDLEAEALKMTQKEQELEPDRIIAEIMHLPESRLGNILIRPKLRNFEIPYLAHGNPPDSGSISITDLYLRMENGRMILFSKSLKKEILPRLTTAHNYTKKSLPVYHLLCELQYQGLQPGFTWHWGFLEGERFLPRVTYKNVILSLACWNLDQNSMKEMLSIKDDHVLKINLTRYRQEMKMPALVFLLDYDNEFLLNLDNIISIRYLFNFIRKRSAARVQEVIWQDQTSPIKGANGQYINELVIPFIKASPTPRSLKAPLKIDTNSKVNRKFYPGSQWLYFKLYLNPESINKILTIVYKFMLKETRRKKIRKWFFVNYADPKLHVRVRFELFSNDIAEGAIAAFFSHLDPLLKNAEVHDIVIAPYTREIERYGTNSMDICEQLFCRSSNIVCNRLSQQITERESILFNLKIAFMLLRPKQGAIQHIHDLCKSSYTALAREFDLDQKRSTRDFLIQEYRELSKDIRRSFMELSVTPAGEYSFLGKEQRGIGSLIAKLYATQELFSGDFDDVIRSLIHMHFNRAYTKNQRFEEMKAYCYLTKYFSSELAVVQEYARTSPSFEATE